MPTSSVAPSSPWSTLFARTRIALFALLVVSVILVAWQRFGMERVIEINGANAYMFTDDDRSPGGATVATFSIKDGTVHMQCHAVAKYAYPYCALAFKLPESSIDLSEYSQVTIKAAYKGPGPSQFRLRFYNYEDGLTKEGQWNTYKINEATTPDLITGQDLLVPIKWMSVAQWWRYQAMPPLEHSYTRIDRVVRIDVVTPLELKVGTHQLTIRYIRLHGKWVSENNLLVILVCIWVIFTLVWVSAAALIARQEIDEGKAKLNLLNEINHGLELEALELAGQAYTDPLTNALNRQGFRDTLIRSTTLMAPPMSVIFADIDHFKKINDEYGHATGDEVLKLFAHRIKSVVRSTDYLVRWGGEEFLIVCQGTDAPRATALAEKLRVSLKRQTWPHGIAMSASFGVAECRADEAIGTIIERADAQLYRAKSGGRDRVASEVETAGAQPSTENAANADEIHV
jgi:diguanylate cyclase (GGDEF)-like protein